MDKKNNIIDTVTGIGAGYAVYRYAPNPMFQLRIKLSKKYLDTPLSDSEISAFKQIGNDLFEQRFKPLGYNLVDVARPENFGYGTKQLEELTKAYDDYIAASKNFIQRACRKYLKNYYVRDYKLTDSAVLQGTNAYYAGKSKTFVLNMDKKPVYLFHEMGHAINAQNPLLKEVSSVYKNPIVRKFWLTAILATSLLTNKKTKEELEQSNNPFAKVNQFVKKNCGILAGLLLLPAVVEECLANVQGQKLAQSIVPKEMMKRVTKTHLHSAIGYVLGAVFAGLAMYLANFVRDKIVHKT